MQRGWAIDETIRVGHIEAALSHIDELLVDEEISKDKKTELKWLAKQLYRERVNTMQGLLNFALDITNKEECRKYWCLLKHCAVNYVMACENGHALGHDITPASDNLALATSLFFGFPTPISCLSCLDEQVKKKIDKHKATMGEAKAK